MSELPPPEKLPTIKALHGDLLGDGGVMKKVLSDGRGELPRPGYRIRCHYVATLIDGTKFDSSRDREMPYEFELGAGRVIKVSNICIYHTPHVAIVCPC
jgi:FKBP-type peptidyl-prolyl cis-trans isomerase